MSIFVLLLDPFIFSGKKRITEVCFIYVLLPVDHKRNDVKKKHILFGVGEGDFVTFSVILVTTNIYMPTRNKKH